MVIKLEKLNVFKFTNEETGYSQDFQQKGESWNGMMELSSVSGETLIVSVDTETVNIAEFFSHFSNEKKLVCRVVKATPALIEKLVKSSIND